jgi:hypothetical protein
MVCGVCVCVCVCVCVWLNGQLALNSTHILHAIMHTTCARAVSLTAGGAAALTLIEGLSIAPSPYAAP